MSTRRRSRPDRATLVKDWTLFGLGLALMGYQAFVLPKAEFNWFVFAMGAGITQAPGALAVLGLLRMPGSSSPPAPDAPSLPPASPSPGASTGEAPTA